MSRDVLNVFNILSVLVKKNPYNKPILTNLLSCQLRDNIFEVTFPESKLLRETCEKMRGDLTQELLNIYGLIFRYRFSTFLSPFLPYPSASSKFNNYLLFIFSDRYFLIKKPEFINGIKNHVKLNFASSGNINGITNRHNLFNFLRSFFVDTVDMLKNEWSYLHPIFLFKDYETMFFIDIIAENVFAEIEKYTNVKDVRRFIGIPCFTVISYEKQLEEWL